MQRGKFRREVRGALGSAVFQQLDRRTHGQQGLLKGIEPGIDRDQPFRAPLFNKGP